MASRFSMFSAIVATSSVSFFGFLRPQTARRSMETEFKFESDSMQWRIERTHAIIRISNEPVLVTWKG